MRVLIVEDHFLVAESLRLTLTEAGHEAIGVAADSEAAIRLAGERRPDVALMDVQLARGSCGVEAAREISARFGVPSLFMTANPETARFARDVALGCLAKPFTDRQVRVALQVVGALLSGEPPGRTCGLELY